MSYGLLFAVTCFKFLMFYVLIVVFYFRLLQEGERRLKSLKSSGISDSESLKIFKSLVLKSITFQNTVFCLLKRTKIFISEAHQITKISQNTENLNARSEINHIKNLLLYRIENNFSFALKSSK